MNCGFKDGALSYLKGSEVEGLHIIVLCKRA
jgi:hypothetical protein